MKNKIVVFDMDETLGCFVQFGIFWDALQEYFFHSLTEKDFFEILDKYPEYLRPKIFSILKYLKRKKEKGQLAHIYIYTNNQGPKSWALKIKRYFEHKLSYKFFDRVIAAFKVRNKVVEICRTTHEKTVDDLLKCTKLSSNTKICFLDDQYHPQMEHETVDYINIKPYTHDIPFEIMINRFMETSIGKTISKDKETFQNFIIKFISGYKYDVTQKRKSENKIDKIASKKMMYYIQEFFKSDHSPKTRKRKSRKSKNKTRKK